MVTQKDIIDLIVDVHLCIIYMRKVHGIIINRFDGSAINQIGEFLTGPNKYDLGNGYFEEIFFLCLAEINCPVDIRDRRFFARIDDKEIDIERIIKKAQMMNDKLFLYRIYERAVEQQKNIVSKVKTKFIRTINNSIVVFRIYVD